MALIGPNGAGKTTAFNCITGVYEPTNGRISFEGRPIVENYPQGKMEKLYQGGAPGGLYPPHQPHARPDHPVRHCPDLSEHPAFFGPDRV